MTHVLKKCYRFYELTIAFYPLLPDFYKNKIET
jgi:hypothetical protein